MFTAEERRQYIGGSDIAAVMGMSRWKTPLTLWLEKTGEIESTTNSDNEAVELGRELEDFVAKKFTRVTGLKVRKRQEKYTHKKYPFLLVQVIKKMSGKMKIYQRNTYYKLSGILVLQVVKEDI